MNQTRKKDHQASSGRESMRRRRTARTDGTACVDEAMAGWDSVNAAASGTEMNTDQCRGCLGVKCTRLNAQCIRASRKADSQLWKTMICCVDSIGGRELELMSVT
jgi:hypothetical protein